MITVHHLNNSRSQRILWLLEELGVPYEIRRHQRDPKTMLAPPELLKVHPLGKAPVITDGDLTIAESGAIVEYLVDAHGPGLRPAPGTPAHRRYVYWLHFAEGSAMPPLLLRLIFKMIKQWRKPFFVRPIANAIADRVLRHFVDPNLARQVAFMEETLKRDSWFAGPEFSAADIQMSFPLEAANRDGWLTEAKTPYLLGWLRRAQARPAYRRALERGGPDDRA